MDAIVYVRISSDPKDIGAGVERQREDCTREAERRGWRVAEVVTDNDQSAFEGKLRPGYQRLLHLIETGQAPAVIAWQGDRLHRDLEDYLGFERLVRKHRAQVVLVKGGDWQVESAAGRIPGRLMAVVAQAESEIKAERVNRALLQRAEAGLPANTRFRPYGFEEDGIKHRPAEVKVLRRAADDLLAGRRTLGAVAREAGKTVTGMRKILTNPRLAGLRQFQGQFYPAVWKPVLARDVWEALRFQLGSGEGAPPARRHLLTGLVRCGSCGKRLSARSTRGKDVYGCLTAAGNDCPKKVQRQSDRLDALVRDAVLYRLTEQGRDPFEAAAGAMAEVLVLSTRAAEIEAAMAEPGAPVSALARAYAAVEAKLTEARETVTAAPVRGGFGAAVTLMGEQYEPHQLPWERWWEKQDDESDAAVLARRRALLASELVSITVLPTAHGRLPLDSNSVKLRWR